jgi:hypothetical protein
MEFKKFKDIKNGLFRYKGVVYSKTSETKAVLIVTGEIKDFKPEDEVQEW